MYIAFLGFRVSNMPLHVGVRPHRRGATYENRGQVRTGVVRFANVTYCIYHQPLIVLNKASISPQIDAGDIVLLIIYETRKKATKTALRNRV